MTSTPQKHRWVVDGIEEGIARIEEDGARIFTLPVALLPAEAREGHVLTVVRTSGAAGASTITITLDDAATTAAMEQSRNQVAAIAKESQKRDTGGNVAL